ncbi:MAG: SPOR domain-containing protein [Proteobacteria bacterium]|nr:SPOR domain-containing protein [Pseudomonadota bacterium]
MGNFSLRLWIIALAAGPVCFYCMSSLSNAFPGVPPAVLGTSLLVVLGIIIGTVLDHMGKRQIDKLIKEGEIWERAGILSRAERNYAQAVRTYDTFLLSPLFSQKISTRLTGALARFSLTTGIESPYLKLASAEYLKSSPGDETLAGLWLGQLKKEGQAGDLEQEVLTALANIHYTHKKLAVLLVDVLLDLGRMDYAAKRLYKNILDDPEMAEENRRFYREKIRELLGEPDEIVEKKVPLHVKSTSLRSLHSPYSLPSRPSRPFRPLDVGRQFIQLAATFPRAVGVGLKSVGRALVSFLSFCILSLGNIIAFVRERERVGFYLKVGAMGILSVWLVFFLGNTISHILNSRGVEKEPKMIEIKVPKPFTIQVAAYLTKDHADRYVAVLKKKGFAPFISKVGGGGKIWYVVRISEFSDKADAAAFGEKLKSEKVIDDFFVSNK